MMGEAVDGHEGEKGKKIIFFLCVVENVRGVRSHPAVINLLAVRNTAIEV